jgi:hypothetical protein
MRAIIVVLLICAARSLAADTQELFGPYDRAYVAQCKQSEVDELQLVGEPRYLSAKEVRQLTQILNAEESWGHRNADGSFTVLRSGCIPYYDFKYLFYRDGEAVASIRLCTYCQQFYIRRGEDFVGGGMMREEAFNSWRKTLDVWFPGWAEVSEKNRKAWYKRPNQSPEPTAMSVTPPAAQEPRQP